MHEVGIVRHLAREGWPPEAIEEELEEVASHLRRDSRQRIVAEGLREVQEQEVQRNHDAMEYDRVSNQS